MCHQLMCKLYFLCLWAVLPRLHISMRPAWVLGWVKTPSTWLFWLQSQWVTTQHLNTSWKLIKIQQGWRQQSSDRGARASDREAKMAKNAIFIRRAWISPIEAFLSRAMASSSAPRIWFCRQSCKKCAIVGINGNHMTQESVRIAGHKFVLSLHHQRSLR